VSEYLDIFQIESLEADKDISNKQLSVMKSRLGVSTDDQNEDDLKNNLKSLDSDSENDGTLYSKLRTNRLLSVWGM